MVSQGASASADHAQLDVAVTATVPFPPLAPNDAALEPRPKEQTGAELPAVGVTTACTAPDKPSAVQFWTHVPGTHAALVEVTGPE
jgi:hypothetical protein